MADLNPFSCLLPAFRDVLASGRSKYFAIEFWGNLRRTEELRSPKRIILCEIMLPVVKQSTGSQLQTRDCLFAVTVPRNQGVEDVGETFAALSSEAGAACAQLPAEFQSRIRPHCSAVTQQPASRWMALLWEFQGGGLFGPAPVSQLKPDFVGPPDLYSGPRAIITQPFLVSVEAIAQCGLHTEKPAFRLREGVAFNPDVDELQHSQLDLTLIGGVTPMPRIGDDGASAHSRANAVATSPSKRVILFGRGDKPVVDDKELRKLTAAQYDVVLALLKAGEDGLTKDELEGNKTGRGGGRGILKRLAKKPGWESVIALPGSTGQRYRIR